LIVPDNHVTGANVSTAGVEAGVPDWWIYRGTGEVMNVAERDRLWPTPPPWRRFSGVPDLPVPELDLLEVQRRLGRFAQCRTTDRLILNRVNVAIALARPLLVTGRAGIGKSTLAHAVALELTLGDVLHWPITSRTTLKSGLFDFDAIARAQAASTHADGDIGNFVRLGPLGTALLPHALPRVLLVDDIDRGNFDLLYDLSIIFDQGKFFIPELVRVREREPHVNVHTADLGVRAPVSDGVVRCHAFPFVVMTSSDERALPASFLRRCITLSLPDPDAGHLSALVAAHFSSAEPELTKQLVDRFSTSQSDNGGMATDQLLDAVHVIRSSMEVDREKWDELLDAVWHKLPGGP
jgi:MoxR-like ATPase